MVATFDTFGNFKRTSFGASAIFGSVDCANDLSFEEATLAGPTDLHGSRASGGIPEERRPFDGVVWFQGRPSAGSSVHRRDGPRRCQAPGGDDRSGGALARLGRRDGGVRQPRVRFRRDRQGRRATRGPPRRQRRRRPTGRPVPGVDGRPRGGERRRRLTPSAGYVAAECFRREKTASHRLSRELAFDDGFSLRAFLRWTANGALPISSGYGERPSYTVLCSVGTVLVFAAV